MLPRRLEERFPRLKLATAATSSRASRSDSACTPKLLIDLPGVLAPKHRAQLPRALLPAVVRTPPDPGPACGLNRRSGGLKQDFGGLQLLGQNHLLPVLGSLLLVR